MESHYPFLARSSNHLDAVLDVQFLAQMPDVNFDGADCNDQRVGYVLIRHASGYELKDFILTLAQATRARGQIEVFVERSKQCVRVSPGASRSLKSSQEFS